MLVFYFIVYIALGIKIEDIFSVKNSCNIVLMNSDIEMFMRFFKRCFRFTLYSSLAIDILKTFTDVYKVKF